MDINASDIYLLAWSGCINQVRKQNNTFMPRNTPRRHIAWGIRVLWKWYLYPTWWFLDRELLEISIYCVFLINYERTILLTAGTRAWFDLILCHFSFLQRQAGDAEPASAALLCLNGPRVAWQLMHRKLATLSCGNTVDRRVTT